MYRRIMFSILCCLVVARLINAAQLRSPCPNVFTYEGEPENDRWYGIMTFSSNIELVGLIYKIQLDRPGQLLVSWDGEVRSEDNIIFSVFDPKHFQRPGEVVKARIMVKFNPSSNPPNVVKIIINGNIMCSGDGNNPLTLGLPTESPSNNRPDPTFVEEDIVSEYNNRPSSNQNTNVGTDKGSRPSYHEPNYGGGSGTNFNTISGSNPNYNGGELNYASNSNSAGYNNANSNYQTPVNPKPSYPSNNNNNQNYPSNPTYSNSPNNYIPAENIVYPSNIQSSSGSSNAQPQWSSSENQQNSYSTSRNHSNSGSSSNNQGPNNGPLVTTLTLPNNTQNKNNVDTIIQIIKNQLEQQQGTSNTNNTVIVALVSPVNSNHGGQQAVPNSSQNRESIIETTTHRTTTSTPSSVVSKLRSTTTSTPTTKSPTIRNKD